MIAAIVDELAPNLVARNSIGHTGAALALRPRQSRKIALGSQLRIAMRRQPGSGVVGKDRQASAQSWRRSRRQPALHIIAIGRLRTDQRTKDYVARRLAEAASPSSTPLEP